MFGKGTTQDRWDAVTLTLDIWEVLSYDKYLGFPTKIGRSKSRAFMPLKDRICKRINGWLSKNLSWAGRCS